jgi:hypothetical protein
MSPTTSSSIAAVVRTVPSLVVVNPLALSTVKVVPKLVEHNAAPVAKAWSGVAMVNNCNVNDRAIGRAIPVIATPIDSRRFVLTAANEVDSPP